jgi:hypothetical protein
VLISLVVRLYRPPYMPYIMFTSFSQTSCKFGGGACKVKSKNVGGNCANGPSANQTRRNSSSSFGKLTSSYEVKTERFKQSCPQLVPDAPQLPRCSLCDKPALLETSKTDEYGKALLRAEDALEAGHFHARRLNLRRAI